MADIGITQLKTQINATIIPNGQRLITGAMLNDDLIDMVDTLKAGGNIDDASIGTAKIQDGAISDGKLSQAVQQALVHPVSVGSSHSVTDFEISDESNRVLVLFQDGHIRTKFFNSKNINILGYLHNGAFYTDSAHTEQIAPIAGIIYIDLTTGEENKQYLWLNNAYVLTGGGSHPIEVINSAALNDMEISDENDHVLVRFKNGHIQTKNFNSETLQLINYTII